jgi:hypothetical protein
MYLEQAKEQFEKFQKERTYCPSVEPATEEEVKELEVQLGLLLPESYKEFLLWTGNGGGVWAGHNFDWRRVYRRNKNAALDAMELRGIEPILPADAIVFLVYQGGHSFAFIRTSEGDNPPVHLFMEYGDRAEMILNYASCIEELYLRSLRK